MRPFLRAGQFRTRVTIQQASETQDSFGTPQKSWSEFAKRWASVETKSGREFFTAGQEQSEVTHVIRMRHLDGVTPAMRAKIGARVLDIEHVVNTGESGKETQLMCREVQS